MKVKKGDEVVVIAGKDRGVKGKVIAADPIDEQGRRRGRQPGHQAHPGHRHRSAAPRPAASSTSRPPISASNVMVIDGEGKATRVGYRRDEESGKNVRVSRRSGKDLS